MFKSPKFFSKSLLTFISLLNVIPYKVKIIKHITYFQHHKIYISIPTCHSEEILNKSKREKQLGKTPNSAPVSDVKTLCISDVKILYLQLYSPLLTAKNFLFLLLFYFLLVSFLSM